MKVYHRRAMASKSREHRGFRLTANTTWNTSVHGSCLTVFFHFPILGYIARKRSSLMTIVYFVIVYGSDGFGSDPDTDGEGMSAAVPGSAVAPIINYCYSTGGGFGVMRRRPNDAISNGGRSD